MAHGLKYKASKTFENADKYEVRIYCDGWTGASYEIGNLNVLSLSLQGDTSTVTAPIIKTSVNIGMVDTPDKGSTAADGTTCVENGVKYGQWEEFYTNDSRRYKVELRYTGGLSRNAVIWAGFLTPDSWGEEMNYGGGISLVARDMLGTLSEYEFDLTGEVSATDIVVGALAKCGSAMAVTFHDTECLENAGTGDSILDALFDASTFAGKDWYQALEQALEGLGLILRYNGNGGYDCTSIRYAVSHAVEQAENAHIPAFYNRSGYRTIDPAVKRIVEIFNPDIEALPVLDPDGGFLRATGRTLTQHYDQSAPFQQDFTYPKYILSSETSHFSGTGAIPFLAQEGYIVGEVPRRGILFPVNTTGTEHITYGSPHLTAPFSLSIASDIGDGFIELSETGGHYYLTRYPFSNPKAMSVKMALTCVKNGQTIYWHNGWGNAAVNYFDQPFGETISVPALDGASDYKVHIVCINTEGTEKEGSGIVGQPMFVPLNFTIAPQEGNDIYGEYKTTTVYNDENHVEINRTPAVGSIDSSSPAVFLPNVLRYGVTPAANLWRWPGENSAGYPLAVLIHAQLLVYNAAQNGNSVFTGNIVDLSRAVSVPGTDYLYYSRRCALLAGSYNCLTGYVEGATLREVVDWDDVWETFDPDWTQATSRTQGGTSAAGGGGYPGGGGGTGGGVRSVGLTMPEGFSVENSPITDSGEISVTLLNGYNLLTDAEKAIINYFGYDETHNAIYVKDGKNFYSFGSVSSGGIGSGGGGGEGGVGSIKVNGTQYLPDTTGMVTLPNYPDDIPTALSQLSDDATHRLVTDTEKTIWNSKYTKPSGGIPKTDLASAVQTSLGLANSALQSHQNIYTLTIQKNGTAVGTYTPNSAAKTINITDVASAAALTELSDKLDDLFVKESDGNGGYRIKAKYGFYSVSFVSAGGIGSGGGGGGGDVSSIKVNGTQYLPNDEGMVTLPNYPTSLNWADIQNKPSWIGSSKPSYAFSEITGTLAATQVPTLAISKVSGLQDALDGKSPKTYTHTQNTAAKEWTIQHNLGERPSVVVVNSLEVQVYGDVKYLDNNSVKVSFSTPFSGKAYLN